MGVLDEINSMMLGFVEGIGDTARGALMLDDDKPSLKEREVRALEEIAKNQKAKK